MDDSTKSIVKVVILAGAALGLYYWLQQSGLWAQWFGGTALPANPNPNPLLPPAGTTTVTTTPPPAPAIPASYNQAAAAMTNSAGAPTQNFDQWSYWWQNNQAFSGAPAGYGVSGSISGTMIDAMIAAGGGDRSKLITAAQWVSLLYQEQQKGVTGLGYFGPVAAVAYGWVN